MLSVIIAYAQSVGSNNDPDNISAPKVTITVNPENGGVAEYYYSEQDQVIQVWAHSSLGYKFNSWTRDGEVVSDELYMNIPYNGEDEINITANFSYDDSLPKLNFRVVPNNGGTIEYNYSELTHELDFWIDPSLYYKFVSWTNNGTIISNKPYVTIPYISGGDDINLLATLQYDPLSPEDPGTNYFNILTGELIIDSFEPGSLFETICKVVSPDDFEYISSCIIAGNVIDEFSFFDRFPNC